MGEAMRTVAAAFAAISEKRFDDLTPLVSDEIDWHGLPDPEFGTPHCRGRTTALERIRVGWLAGGAVSVEAFVESGERVLARVKPRAPGAATAGGATAGAATGAAASGAAASGAAASGGPAAGPSARFVIAEVHDGQITELRAYSSELEAQAALAAPVLPAAAVPGA